MPPTELWYLHPTKQCFTRQFTEPYQMFLGNSEAPMFIRGGTILPMMALPAQGSGDVKSLLQVYPRMEVNLELYLDAEGTAEGMLYWDDGITFNNDLKLERALALFRYDKDGLLSVTRMLDNSMSQFSVPVKIVDIEVYSREQ